MIKEKENKKLGAATIKAYAVETIDADVLSMLYCVLMKVGAEDLLKYVSIKASTLEVAIQIDSDAPIEVYDLVFDALQDTDCKLLKSLHELSVLNAAYTSDDADDLCNVAVTSMLDANGYDAGLEGLFRASMADSNDVIDFMLSHGVTLDVAADDAGYIHAIWNKDSLKQFLDNKCKVHSFVKEFM